MKSKEVKIEKVESVESLSDMERKLVKLMIDKALIDSDLVVKKEELKDLRNGGVMTLVGLIGGTALFVAGIGGFIGAFFGEPSQAIEQGLPIMSGALAAAGMGAFACATDEAKGKTWEEIAKTYPARYKAEKAEYKSIKTASNELDKEIKMLGKKIAEGRKEARKTRISTLEVEQQA